MADKKFGQRTFRCNKLPASESVGLAFRLGKLAAPLLENFASGGLSFASIVGAGENAQGQKALGAIAKFLTSIDPKEGQALLIELAEKAQLQQPGGNFEPVIFDSAFAGEHIGDSIQVAAWVVQVNLSDFFKGVPLNNRNAAKMPGS